MKTIQLTRGQVAYIDDDMFDLVSKYDWYAAPANTQKTKFYAARTVTRPDGERRREFLHHYIIGRPITGLVTDHINGDSLNNTRENLRHVTTRTNLQNCSTHRRGRLIGSTYSPKKGRKNPWRSQINLKGKPTFLGYYKTEQEAHDRYMEVLNNGR